MNSIVLEGFVGFETVGDFKDYFSSFRGDDSSVDGGLANGRVHIVDHESDDISGFLFASTGTDELELFSGGALEVVTSLKAVVVTANVVLGQTNGVGFFLFTCLIISGSGKGVGEFSKNLGSSDSISLSTSTAGFRSSKSI